MAEKFGRPQIIIDFQTKSTTAITRSGRGVGVLILNDENVTDRVVMHTIVDTTEIPDSGISDKNVDLIKKALLGTPSKLFILLIPPKTYEVSEEVEVPGEGDSSDTTITTVVKHTVISEIKQADALNQDQQDLASWIKSQRQNKRRTVKGVVANVDADSYGVINFTTGNIRVVNPDYTDALVAAEGVASNVPADIPQYLKYTAAEYTARILGIACGVALDRSMTYYELNEIVDCDVYDDVDENINNGELCLIDEGDGNGVKIARACNSLHTFTTNVGQDFRYIKIVEAIDLITDDIRDTFRNDYIGKVNNSYDNKMLFIAAILVYFEELKGTVLDGSPTAKNTVDIDVAANTNYAKLHGDDTSDMTVQELREYNTGTNVFLDGRITPLNAMEDLKINFIL